MKKKIFLVDLENVQLAGLRGIIALKEQDEVVLFHGLNEKKRIDMLQMLFDDFVRCIKIVKSGQNALDFQLSSYLGYRIGKGDAQTAQFWIVSKDKGFDSVVRFWNMQKIQGLSLRRVSCIRDVFTPPPAPPPVPPPPMPPPTVDNQDEDGQKPLPQSSASSDCQLPPRPVRRIETLIEESSTLRGYHDALVNEYGLPLAKNLFDVSRQLFKQYKQLP